MVDGESGGSTLSRQSAEARSREIDKGMMAEFMHAEINDYLAKIIRITRMTFVQSVQTEDGETVTEMCHSYKDMVTSWKTLPDERNEKAFFFVMYYAHDVVHKAVTGMTLNEMVCKKAMLRHKVEYSDILTLKQGETGCLEKLFNHLLNSKRSNVNTEGRKIHGRTITIKKTPEDRVRFKNRPRRKSEYCKVLTEPGSKKQTYEKVSSRRPRGKNKDSRCCNEGEKLTNSFFTTHVNKAEVKEKTDEEWKRWKGEYSMRLMNDTMETDTPSVVTGSITTASSMESASLRERKRVFQVMIDSQAQCKVERQSGNYIQIKTKLEAGPDMGDNLDDIIVSEYLEGISDDESIPSGNKGEPKFIMANTKEVCVYRKTSFVQHDTNTCTNHSMNLNSE